LSYIELFIYQQLLKGHHEESKVEPLTLESLSDKYMKLKSVEIKEDTAKDNAIF